jgi:hypothetical protein
LARRLWHDALGVGRDGELFSVSSSPATYPQITQILAMTNDECRMTKE